MPLLLTFDYFFPYFTRSNCDPIVRDELRKYYSKPGFIPDDAETGDQDWIFMGGPGPGAPIHVSQRQPCFQDLTGSAIFSIRVEKHVILNRYVFSSY